MEHNFQSVFMFKGEKARPFLPIGLYISDINDWGRFTILDPRSIDEQFTQEEKEYCGDRVESYAGRFAAKMAVMQIMGGDLSLLEISIGALPSRQPIVRLSGDSKKIAGAQNIVLSISHDADLAVAMAALVSSGSDRLGIGTDIASCDRMYNAFQRHGDRFLQDGSLQTLK